MRKLLGAFTLSLAIGLAGAAAAQEAMSVDETLADIKATFGFVPTFIGQLPPAALPGAWAELKAIELSETTALPAKIKSLISLAVAAQIPCQYCVWLDTMSARQAGATDQEIQEAVTMSALTRHWSTLFNGLQVDFDTLKTEFAPAQ
jgi:AhpD family alkylhydroperoxidase